MGFPSSCLSPPERFCRRRRHGHSRCCQYLPLAAAVEAAAANAAAKQTAYDGSGTSGVGGAAIGSTSNGGNGGKVKGRLHCCSTSAQNVENHAKRRRQIILSAALRFAGGAGRY
ncbi:unnamed protein product, partial [Phaeothamnion confervicola]